MASALSRADLDTIRFHLEKGVSESTVADWFDVSVRRMLNALIRDDEKRAAEATRGAAQAVQAATPRKPTPAPIVVVDTVKPHRRPATEIEEFLLRSRPRMLLWALRLTQNYAAAEDLISATYVRAIERQHRYQPGTNPAGWVSVVMRNIYINDYRRDHHGKHARIAVDIDDVAWLIPSPAPQEHVVLLREASELLEAMPAAQRDTIKAVRLEGMSYEAAANHFGVETGTIKSRLSRGTDNFVAKVNGTDRLPS